MTPDDMHVEQMKLTRALAAALARLLSPFVGVTLTKATLRTIAVAILPVLRANREKQRALAERYYTELKHAGMPESPPVPRPPIRDVDETAITNLLSNTLEVGKPIRADSVETVIVKTDQVARNAQRNQTVAYSFADKDVLGWARVDPKPPTCSFCTMLISRGPVYTTAETAGDRNHYHGGCTCIPVLVLKSQKNSWPGRDKFLEAEKLYKEHKGNMKAFRSAVDQRNGKMKGQVGKAANKATETGL